MFDGFNHFAVQGSGDDFNPFPKLPDSLVMGTVDVGRVLFIKSPVPDELSILSELDPGDQ